MNDAMGQDVLLGIVTMNRIDKLTRTLQECAGAGYSQLDKLRTTFGADIDNF